MKNTTTLFEFTSIICVEFHPIVQRAILLHAILVQILLFPSEYGLFPSRHNARTTYQVSIVNHYLVKFVVNYLQAAGWKVSPNTMSGYISNIFQLYRESWYYALSYHTHPVSKRLKTCLHDVIYICFGKQQAAGIHVESHNGLGKDGLVRLFASARLSNTIPESYLFRLLFVIALMAAMKPLELSFLQFLNSNILSSTVSMLGPLKYN